MASSFRRGFLKIWQVLLGLLPLAVALILPACALLDRPEGWQGADEVAVASAEGNDEASPAEEDPEPTSAPTEALVLVVVMGGGFVAGYFFRALFADSRGA